MTKSTIITTENSEIDLDQDSLLPKETNNKNSNKELDTFLSELSNIKLSGPISSPIKNKEIFLKLLDINGVIFEVKCFATLLTMIFKPNSFIIKILLPLKDIINLEKELSDIFDKKTTAYLNIFFEEENIVFNKKILVNNLKKIKILKKENDYMIKITFSKE